MRRVWETTQFVVDVMSTGGLAPGGMGRRTAQKVRLMHAAVRHLVQSDPNLPWSTSELGLPINQEDLAATLMEFSYVILEGLGRLGIDVTRQQREAYLGTWRTIGGVLGVRPELVPSDIDEASSLTRTIAARQIGRSDEGGKLAAALVEGLQTLMPPGLAGFIPSAMRFFLERDLISGRDIAAILAVPSADWSRSLVVLAGELAGLGGELAGEDVHVGTALRALRMHYIDLLLQCERGPGRPAFRIPQRLRDLWSGEAS